MTSGRRLTRQMRNSASVSRAAHAPALVAPAATVPSTASTPTSLMTSNSTVAPQITMTDHPQQRSSEASRDRRTDAVEPRAVCTCLYFDNRYERSPHAAFAGCAQYVAAGNSCVSTMCPTWDEVSASQPHTPVLHPPDGQ